MATNAVVVVVVVVVVGGSCYQVFKVLKLFFYFAVDRPRVM